MAGSEKGLCQINSSVYPFHILHAYYTYTITFIDFVLFCALLAANLLCFLFFFFVFCVCVCVCVCLFLFFPLLSNFCQLP